MSKLDGTETKPFGDFVGQILTIKDEWLYYSHINYDSELNLTDELRRINLDTFVEEIMVNKSIQTTNIQDLVIHNDALIYKCDYIDDNGTSHNGVLVQQNIGETESTILAEELGVPISKVADGKVYYAQYNNSILCSVEIN